MRIARPVSGRPGIDVQVLLVAVTVLYGVRSACVAHLTELPDHLVDQIEIALAHFDPVTEVMTRLVRVFRRPKTLRPVISRI